MSDMRTDIIANDVFISWTGRTRRSKTKSKNACKPRE